MNNFSEPQTIRDDDQVGKYHYGWWQMLKDFIRILLYTARGGK